LRQFAELSLRRLPARDRPTVFSEIVLGRGADAPPFALAIAAGAGASRCG
jgi:hypothetical protein